MKAVLAFCLSLSILSLAPARVAGQADPTLAWSTYLGGTNLDEGRAIAMDPEGNTYVVGLSYSSDFPLVSPYRSQFQASEVFVTKVAPDGTVLFSTYLGGSGGEWGEGAVVAGGSLYVTGFTSSPDFPLVNPLPAELRGRGGSEAFIVRMSLDGSEILWSTTFGGSGSDSADAVAVDEQGDVYIAGTTDSPDLAAQGAFAGGANDTFVARISPAGPALVWAAYLGGSGLDRVNALALAPGGKTFVAGLTRSADFPVLSAREPELQGTDDGFLAGFDPAGHLFVSTYLGGTGIDAATGVAVDAAGSLIVGGTSHSIDLGTTPFAFQRKKSGGGDAFAMKLAPDARTLVWATYLGGSGDDGSAGMGIDATGNVYLTGIAQSGDFPLRHPVDSECAPGSATFCHGEAYVAKLSPGGAALLFSTYLGGSINPIGDGQTALEVGESIAVSPEGAAAITGESFSSDLPTVNAFQPAYPGAGSRDGFAARFTAGAPNPPPDCSKATATPSTIWPPDRRQVRITLGGATDPVGDPITLKVTRILQDELFTARMPDAGGIGTAKPWVRADRMDNGDGRVYHIFFEVTNPGGGRCTGEVEVCVPIQSGGTCGDGGARIDSTLPR